VINELGKASTIGDSFDEKLADGASGVERLSIKPLPAASDGEYRTPIEPGFLKQIPAVDP